MTVVARQFALMGEAGYENFISSCITSFGIYTEILATWEEFPETEERAREALYKATGRTLVKPKNLAHTSDVVFHHREAIAARARHRLVNVLERLVANGNTVVVIEHNLDVIKTADYIIDLGPEGGIGGGTLVACGTPEEIAACPASYTGQYLKSVLDND